MRPHWIQALGYRSTGRIGNKAIMQGQKTITMKRDKISILFLWLATMFRWHAIHLWKKWSLDTHGWNGGKIYGKTDPILQEQNLENDLGFVTWGMPGQDYLPFSKWVHKPNGGTKRIYGRAWNCAPKDHTLWLYHSPPQRTHFLSKLDIKEG